MSGPGPEQARAAVLAALAEIAPEIEPAALDAAAPLREQVDLDSFDLLNVIIRINELLGVVIPESDYAQLASIDSTVDYLVARGG